MNGSTFYTYVDGESHFCRLENAWKQLHGPDATLDRLRHTTHSAAAMILYIPTAKVFWMRHWSPGQRTMYFTAASGDEAQLHAIQAKMRDFELEPNVAHERTQLANRRRTALENAQVIEKAKGVDIAITVKMLEDAQAGLYDACNLYTSDIDYLPLIHAVKRIGKKVFIHGLTSGLARCSPFHHAPDKFVDLGEILKNECELLPPP